MLLAALSNAACLYNAFFLLIFANAFCFHALSWFFDAVSLFQVSFCIMRSAFNLLVFPNSMFTPFFMRKGYVLSGVIIIIIIMAIFKTTTTM